MGSCVMNLQFVSNPFDHPVPVYHGLGVLTSFVANCNTGKGSPFTTELHMVNEFKAWFSCSRHFLGQQGKEAGGEWWEEREGNKARNTLRFHMISSENT